MGDTIFLSLLPNTRHLAEPFQEKKIPVMRDYMVTPHHSGVYPVVDHLYDAWVEERGVVCTSTEEYPRYVPHWERRGFIYKGIMVRGGASSTRVLW